jgi:hypothetical protein
MFSVADGYRRMVSLWQRRAESRPREGARG